MAENVAAGTLNTILIERSKRSKQMIGGHKLKMRETRFAKTCLKNRLGNGKGVLVFGKNMKALLNSKTRKENSLRFVTRLLSYRSCLSSASVYSYQNS